MTRPIRRSCPVCGSSELTPGPRVDGVPAHAVRLAHSVADARAEPRGSIALVSCRRCGLVFNAEFDGSLLSYGTDYESTQTHSPTYRTYVDELVAVLLARSDDTGAIVDVGCGQGEFLAAFAGRTARRLIGFDPAIDETRSQAASASLSPTVFDPNLVEGPVSLITCKMTLEHVDEPVGLLSEIAELATRTGAPAFLQVPNCSHIFEQVLVADVIYEHVNYFTVASISAACARAGLEVVDTAITYGGQHLGVIARAGDGSVSDDAVAAACDEFDRFAAEIDERVAEVRGTIRGLLAAGHVPVLWGAGSKAVALLALTRLEAAIPLAVDINPLKHGTFLPGSGIEIVAPGDARLRDATDVFVMNPAYADEVGASLRDHGLDARLRLIG